MLFTTILPLTFLTGVLATPLPITQTATSTCSTLITRLDYYQGYTSPTQCGVDVFQGNITSGVCINITTQGLMLFPSDSHCVFSLWKGNVGCSGDPTSTFDLGVAAEGTQSVGTCVGTGVLDGGKFYHGSGFLSCGC
ncbi:hypothetical protein SBOR_5541 [Sclerotinia borealis F-4128]|uniref:Uncharacterized protein n=1 Tax=Sclerotinia borealis (strain F-4128) TaxID=1432307 RepID=W9CHP5_SCLBF|nr:hypothetical protein SBOR_5541 [Sclerotinia borealis F-4128]